MIWEEKPESLIVIERDNLDTKTAAKEFYPRLCEENEELSFKHICIWSVEMTE